MIGWKRNAVLFFLGVLATLALPPFFAWPLLVPAFSGLYYFVSRAQTRTRAFADGWWWGWGFYITGLYWFTIALMVDPEKFAWLIPFALFALNAVIALYSGVACLLWRCTRTRGLGGIFVFSVAWTLVEYARGHLLSGFPWNLAGYSFAASDALLQIASVVGAYGMTWLAVFLAAIPACWFDGAVPRRQAKYALGLAVAAFAIMAGWGAWRIDQAGETRYVPGVVLRLVQANIGQKEKWEPQQRQKGLEEYIRLTRSPGWEKITHVIWPETAVPYAIRGKEPLTRMLGQATPPGALLITGGMRLEGDEEDWRVYNSITAFDHRGAIVGSYDKVRLVPFGEFIPLRRLLPDGWLLPAGAKDFSRGPGAQTISWPKLPAAVPLICYEVIFPEFVAAAPARPAWMLNLTNDAWFGASSGPYQHFQMARVRAVEQGIPLVRVANTGITAIVDGYGRIISKMGLEEKGVVDALLPAANNNLTIYNIYNNLFFAPLLMVVLMLIISQHKKRNT